MKGKLRKEKKEITSTTIRNKKYDKSICRGVADFNRDGHPDYMLYKASTRQTAIWYLNNNIFVGCAYGPTLPAGWSLVADVMSPPNPWDY